ncbi:glycosyltransferase family 87 protein [Flaviaesturariibacter aridisoli]|uniref:DUF2029 domain-containing protein n=1 Tax=Flaviaesturariibacter aridisoli TaxID=2545761 RepID=A0A4R4DWC2_9BACT|nr:glycosyltransferase family 87 protein [Flaviaesturariibacter aridisoli]TCZ68390.1 DUF2029 domain-containing protein [Flaviaesturariibacter aridisoli]
MEKMLANKPTWAERLADRRTLYVALAFWFGLSALLAFQHVQENTINNYLIFRNVFWHTLQGQNLYSDYASQHGDQNHYGPFFSLVIAPFAVLPDWAGVLLWVTANAAFLLFAVWRMPLRPAAKTALLLLCANELMINSGQLQANALTCACILLGFSYTQRGREHWALFFILFGAFIKIYAIVGGLFLLFSRHKARFIGWGLLWSAVFFVAPMLITEPGFILQSYGDWYASLQAKSVQNTDPTLGLLSLDQNISVMGMISRIFNPAMNTTPVWLTGIVLFLSQLRRWRDFGDIRLRFYLLASVLLFTVLFSNGSEACTYIIAVMGMCLWYLVQEKTRRLHIFFFTLLVLTTFLYSDLLGGYWLRQTLVKPYSLKALCPLILWLRILVQVHRRQYSRLAPWAVRVPEEDQLIRNSPYPLRRIA